MRNVFDRPVPEVAEDEPQTWLESVVTRRLIVHLTSGQSIDGSLVEIFPDGVVLRAARLLDGDRPTPMGGETYIPREKVAFAQLAT